MGAILSNLPGRVGARPCGRDGVAVGYLWKQPGMAGQQDQSDGAVRERTTTRRQDPLLYKVVLLNDDYTTMEFVVRVLESIFQKSPAEAYRIMMHVHLNGRGIAGVYPWEVAETKAETVTAAARDAGYPLRAVTEEA
jgi:ATP-dependent Clp protease adaptor protein ClpS